MTALENLIEALTFYEIEIISVEGNHVKLRGNYEVKVEVNGLYKLLDEGYIVAPFDDITELCGFILT
jgi:hypothetical protein